MGEQWFAWTLFEDGRDGRWAFPISKNEVVVHAKKKFGDKYQKYIEFVNENLQYKEKTWVREDDMANWGLLCW